MVPRVSGEPLLRADIPRGQCGADAGDIDGEHSPLREALVETQEIFSGAGGGGDANNH